MKRTTLVFSLIALLLFAGLATAALAMAPDGAGSASTMSAANELYQAGHYAEAAQLMEQLLAGGVDDSAVYYNLGNTYFRQGNLGGAVLNYERAAQLAPRDRDIRANLALARELAGAAGPSGDQAGGPPAALAAVTRSWLSLDELAIVALAAWFLLGLTLLIGRDLRPGKMPAVIRYAAVALVLTVLAFGLLLGSRAMSQETDSGGTIVAPAVIVSSGPDAQG